MRKTFLLFLLFLGLLDARAAVRLPAVLASNMVLQQQSSVKLWGWSEPRERIAIVCSWDNHVDSVKGSRDGKWQVLVHTPAAGGPYTIEIKGSNRILLENVLIGEVWVCSGQSNMEMCETWGLPDVRTELPTCYNANIRFFQIPKTTAAFPQDDCHADWTVCDSNTLKRFSAVGYFFGKKLNKDLNVPIGLIQAAWGGTPAEVWTPEELMNTDTVLQNALTKVPLNDGWPHAPGYCYNAMIAPVTKFCVAGALWYQGESNTPAPLTYDRLLTKMIASWRMNWDKPLSFYLVQIAPFKYGVKDQGAVLREQEEKVQRLENTGMVVISDITGDTSDIHPKNKHDVGIRLANWALADTYHKQGLVYKNPSYHRMTIEGDKVLVYLADAAGGLEVRGKEVQELFIAGADQVFYPAQVKIKGDVLTVFAKEVKKPVAVRYQYSNTGIGNLFSKQGLPVAPFRTDDWVVF